MPFPNSGEIDNFMWHAVRAFFEEGGKRLYVSRTFRGGDSNAGVARAASSALGFGVSARFPGQLGNFRVTFTLSVGQNILVGEIGRPQVKSLTDRDVVLVFNKTLPLSPPSSPPEPAIGFYLALEDAPNGDWKFARSGDSLAGADLSLQDIRPQDGWEIRIVTVGVTVESPTLGALPFVAANLPLDPKHQRAGSKDSLFAYFAPIPASLSQARWIPIVLDAPAGNRTGVDVLNGFAAQYPLLSPPVSPPDPGLLASLEDPQSSVQRRSVVVVLTGGNDGRRPTASEYEGDADPTTDAKTGLKQFEDLEDISIVAAPGSTFGLDAGYQDQARTITSLLITHADQMRYRIAVLDCGNDQSISAVRAHRARYDSKYAAIYYPWVTVLDPLTQAEVNLPPSGFVSGIYARNDVNCAVYKAPANEVVNLALGFEKFLNKSQQEVLNPEGINCFRYFEGRGNRLWGARTISSDPEWKYVNLRRYFAYLERSIDKGTQWAVFEPNGELLWANVRRTIEDFLLNEWQNGALLGDKPEKAYFVKCDRSTMSQNDLDNGRLICLIGVAPLRPAEFVIFRIGQWTADRKI